MSKVVSFRDKFGEHFVNPLLVAMAERVGVDLALTESPAQLEGMERGCARCQMHEHCDDWTHSSDSPESVDYRSFCLNTDSLDRLWMHAANLFDGNRLQWSSFKTDFHPDRETRARQPAMSGLAMRDEVQPLQASLPLQVGDTDAAEDVLLMPPPAVTLREVSAPQCAADHPDAQDSEVEGGGNDAINGEVQYGHPTPIALPVGPAVRPARRSGWGWAIAASIAAVAMFGGGAMWGGRAPSERADLVEEIAGYHEVYSRETAHLVEVPASQAEQLTAWLGERLDHEIKVPDLADAGLHFAGGRMLVVNDRPVAELMYTRAHGLPVAVCVTQIEGKPWSMDVEQHGALRVATWAKDAYAYVVVGEIGDEQARDLAWRVKAQI
jgi:anti-sigma factor RsiW